jgi:hypothetical protein
MSTPTPVGPSLRNTQDNGGSSGKDFFSYTPTLQVKPSKSKHSKSTRQSTELTIDLTPNPAIKPSADLIADYIAYADRFEIPRVMHESVMIAGIAALVNGKVRIKNGGQIVTLDLWMLLISRSGSGRNTLLRTFRDLLDRIGLGDLIHRETWGSAAYVEEYFSKNPSGFFLWAEMSQAMRQLSQSHFAGARQFITDLYDETQIPSSKHYRERKKKEEETPAIEFSHAPRTNFLATTSEAWFFSSTRKDDVAGGFIPRWCPEVVREDSKTIPTPDEADSALIPPLLEKLKLIARLEGEMDFSQVKDLYNDWYAATKRRFDAQPDRYLADAFWGRHRAHMLKLVAVIELATSATLTVSPGSFKRAEAIARRWEENIFELLRTSFSTEGVESRQLEEMILSAGPEGLSKTDFASIARGNKRIEMRDRVRTLIDGEIVFPFIRQTGGRPMYCLVHRAHMSKHAQEFPEDRQGGTNNWQ